MATLYNDKSILESLHSMTLFQLLHKHGIDTLVGNLNSVAYKGNIVVAPENFSSKDTWLILSQTLERQS